MNLSFGQKKSMLPKIFRNFENLILVTSQKRDGNLKNDARAQKKFFSPI